MANLNFKGGRRDRLYSAQLNSLAYANKNGVLVGCVATKGSNLRNVNISDGSIFYGLNTITVENTVVAIPSNSSSNDRLDLIVVNQSGVISLVQGNASVVPSTPDYDPEVFICLAIIRARGNAISIIPEDIIDNRVENIGGSGSGGGTFLRKTQPFEDESEIVVLHNFGDSEPLVFVYDDDNKIIIPDEVEVVSNQEIKVTLSSSSSGVVVVYGGTGVNNAYYSSEFLNNTTWNVEHNLNQKYVTVQCIDNNDKKIEPLDVEYVDENNLIVTFSNNTTGKVVCSGGSSQFDNVDGNVTKVQIKRGTDSARETTEFEEGELFYTTDTNELYVGDGNAGGIPTSLVDDFTISRNENRELKVNRPFEEIVIDGNIITRDRFDLEIANPSGTTTGNIQNFIDYEFTVHTQSSDVNNYPKIGFRNGIKVSSRLSEPINTAVGNYSTRIDTIPFNVLEHGLFLNFSFHRGNASNPEQAMNAPSQIGITDGNEEYFIVNTNTTSEFNRNLSCIIFLEGSSIVVIVKNLESGSVDRIELDSNNWNLETIKLFYFQQQQTTNTNRDFQSVFLLKDIRLVKDIQQALVIFADRSNILDNQWQVSNFD